MRMRTGALVLAGVLFGGAALLPAVSEGRGGGPGRGGRCGQTECRQVKQDCRQDGQRLRDGSCGNTSCPQDSNDCGPRNCYGNRGGTQQDGAGAPSQR